MKYWRTSALVLAAAAALVLLIAFVRRVPYGYDLEWMEGGMLCHALRFLEGKPIYAPPSVDFVPYLYTPFYPVLLALLSYVFGLGYGLGRVVSLAGFFAAWLSAYSFV